MIAPSRAIFRVPKDRTMVTMELSASGIAATARATAKRKASSGDCPCQKTLSAKISPHRIRMPTDRRRPNWSRLTWSGVSCRAVVLSRAAILPISVSIPVPVTRKRPRP